MLKLLVMGRTLRSEGAGQRFDGNIEDVTFVSMTDDVYKTSAQIIIFPERQRGKYFVYYRRIA